MYKRYNNHFFIISSTWTDEDGYYKFKELGAGKYYVRFCKPDGWSFTSRDAGTNTLDSDAKHNGKTSDFYLDAGENDLSWDAGMYRKASVGDFVWYDSDEDGIQDDDESGLAGVNVTLYSCENDGTHVAATTTNGDGYYKFSCLEPGEYYVEFELLDNHEFSDAEQGADREKDSNANENGRTSCFTLESGDCNMTIDAGMYEKEIEKAGLGDYVWNDLNNNGKQDAGEPAVSGVVVELYSCEGGSSIASTTTDDSGFYEFTDLVPGSYYLKFTSPVDYSFAQTDAAGDDTVDSDAGVNGITSCFELAAGEYDHTIDAGLIKNTESIPEFPTMALPMVAVIGLAFVFRRKNE